MLRIKTKIGVSNTHGLGLFADEFIKKGTVTWQYDPDFDLSYTKDQLDQLPEIQKKTLTHYSYFDDNLNKFVIPIDDLRFINHSVDESKVNIISTPTQDVAGRDIEPGEEFFCNYNNFDNEYFPRVGLTAEQIL